jgi:hypothetical protein
MPKALTSGHTIILALSANVNINSSWDSAFGMERPDSLLLYRYSGFLESYPSWLLEDEAGVVVSAPCGSSATGKTSGSCKTRHIQKCGLGMEGWLHGPLAHRISSLCIQLICSRPQHCRRTCGKASGNSDDGRCQPVESCSRECCEIPYRLPSISCRPPRTHIVTIRHPYFDHLIACANRQWRVVKSETQKTRVVKYFLFWL